MISKFSLKFGRAPGLAAEQIEAAPVTVFVGPNNSGKSKVLSEIEQYCRSGQKNAGAVILEELTFVGFGLDEAARSIERVKLSPEPNDNVNIGDLLVGTRGQRYHVNYQQLIESLQTPSLNPFIFCRCFLTFHTLLLDGTSRINLVQQQPGGDLQQRPHTSFQTLFHDDVKRHEVRRIVADAFGSYFVLDPTFLGQLRIRLSERPPKQ
jgi:hypothetical protein